MLSRFASDKEINFVMILLLLKQQLQQKKPKRPPSISYDTGLWRDSIYTKSEKRLAYHYHLVQKVVFTFKNESQFSSPQKARLAGAYYQVHPRLGTTTA